jgi:hypothetical protein
MSVVLYTFTFSTFASTGDGDVAWTNASNARLSDGSFATVTLGAGQTSEYLYASSCNAAALGFEATYDPRWRSLVWNNPVIDKVCIGYVRSVAGAQSVVDTHVILHDGTSQIGDNMAAVSTSWPTGSGVLRDVDVTGMATALTVPQLLTRDFGVRIRCSNSGGSTETARIDHVFLTLAARLPVGRAIADRTAMTDDCYVPPQIIQ